MRRTDTRRQERVEFSDSIRLCWEENSNGTSFGSGHCINLSRNGLGIELNAPIPLRSIVSFRCERSGLSATAIVRYCQRRGSRYSVGLESNSVLETRALRAA
jgi:hypothetical protein